MSKIAYRSWYLFDAKDKPVGRLAVEIARLLQGKHKPTYTPNVDCGDNVLVLNSKKIYFSGKKWKQKVYRKHTGYIGHLKEVPASQLIERYPERILLHAIRGMIPKTVHRQRQLNRLHIRPNLEHPFQNIFQTLPEEQIKQDDTKEIIIPQDSSVIFIDTWDLENKEITSKNINELPEILQDVVAEQLSVHKKKV